MHIYAFSTILLTALLTAPLTDGHAADEIILTTQEWAPYQTYVDGKLGGFAVETVQCVMAKLNQPYSVTVVPWKRAQVMVQRGKAHGFFSASKNSERDEYATLSDTIAEQQWYWYLLSDSSLSPRDPTFRERALVSAMLGSNMRTWLIDNEYRIVDAPYDTMALFTKLLERRYDGVLANRLVAQEVFKQLDIPPETFRSHQLMRKPLGVYFSKRFLAANPDFLDAFNAHIPQCRIILSGYGLVSK